MTLDPTRFDMAVLPDDMAPSLTVVIDTEEEFDWTAPFSRLSRGTRNLGELVHLQAILDRHGAVPLYVIDHPVASNVAAMRWMSDMRDRGLCEIGAHMHPWVTPPHDESVSNQNSFTCNLPDTLQLAKIATLTRTITEAVGERPTTFRTGRYGVGNAVFQALKETGYTTDLSLAPNSCFTAQGGPEFYGWHNRPFWADPEKRLLSLPVTTGFSGALRGFGTALAPYLDKPLARQMRVPGVLAHMRLLERARLTPEGTGLREMQRLISALVRDGEKVLTLSLHSSTLLPGATVYARDETERDALLKRLDTVLGWFTSELGGVLASVSHIDATIRNVQGRSPKLKSDLIGSGETV